MSEANAYYVAAIARKKNGIGYAAYFADAPLISASGKNIPETITRATDALGAALRSMAGSRAEIPAPSDLETVREIVAGAWEKLSGLFGQSSLDDVLYQYIPAPNLDMIAVRINIIVSRGILEEIDRKAASAGMTRSSYLATAALAYKPGRGSSKKNL